MCLDRGCGQSSLTRCTMTCTLQSGRFRNSRSCLANLKGLRPLLLRKFLKQDMIAFSKGVPRVSWIWIMISNQRFKIWLGTEEPLASRKELCVERQLWWTGYHRYIVRPGNRIQYTRIYDWQLNLSPWGHWQCKGNRYWCVVQFCTLHIRWDYAFDDIHDVWPPISLLLHVNSKSSCPSPDEIGGLDTAGIPLRACAFLIVFMMFLKVYSRFYTRLGMRMTIRDRHTSWVAFWVITPTLMR